MNNESAKRILILTAPAGNGHNAISNAIKTQLEELYGSGVNVLIYDLFKSSDKFRAWMLSKFYFWTAKHFLGTLNRGYARMKNRDVTKVKNTSLHALVSPVVRRKAEKFIDAFCPDAIVCAHTAAALVMSDFKKQGKVSVPVFNIISDYDIPPFLECCTAVDYFISPSRELNADLVRRGIRPEQIFSFGIPVYSKFSKPLDKTETRRELGIREDMFTVLIMNGGVGFGDSLKIIKNIFASVPDDAVQILSVCGLNKKMKKQIDALIKSGQKNLYNFGFVKNVDLMMSASDLLIGKMGGLTTTEALNKKLCMLALTKLPAQEYDNMLFLKERGICGYIAREKDAGKMVAEYIKKPELLAKMQEKMDILRRPSAAQDISVTLFRTINGEAIYSKSENCEKNA